MDFEHAASTRLTLLLRRMAASYIRVCGILETRSAGSAN